MMLLRNKLVFCVFCLLIASSAAYPITPDELKSKVGQATRGFDDITLSAKVQYANKGELKKIGKDFLKSYEFKDTTVWFRYPDKMRIEGRLGMVTARLVMDALKKTLSIPSLRYHKTEDVSHEPHKRQTDYDIGIISGSLWRDYMVQEVEVEKNSDPVYRITCVRENSRNKKIVSWVDAATFKLLKVEKFEKSGKLISRTIYSNHVLVNGLWVPKKVDVYSTDGKLAGTTAYENIKVNTNLPDSTFKH